MIRQLKNITVHIILASITVCLFVVTTLAGGAYTFKKTTSINENRATIDQHIKEGRSFLYSGNYKKAIELFEYIIKLDKNYLKAYASLGMAYMKSGNQEMAQKYLSYVKKRSDKLRINTDLDFSHINDDIKDSWKAHFEKGESYYANNMYKEAIDEYRKSLLYDKNLHLSYFSMGAAFKEMNEYGMALENWERAMEYKPEDKLIKKLFAKLKKEWESYKEFQKLKKEVEKDPSNIKYIFSLGLIYMERGEYAKAEDQFVAILKKAPQNRDAYLGLSTLKSATGKIGESIDILKKFLVFNRSDQLIKTQLNMLTEYNNILNENRFLKNSLDIDLNKEMVLVKKGKFYMGSNDKDINTGVDERPEREIFLNSFYMDKYEVTNFQYKQFVSETNHEPPFHWKGRSNTSHQKMTSLNEDYYPKEGDYYPVSYVTWHDAEAFCRWIKKRLPTEAEWEKAARGKDRRKYPWGNSFDRLKTNTALNHFKGPTPVGSFPSGASPYGIYDMSGNVWEWTNDSYQAYKGADLNRDAFNSDNRVVRGGSFLDPPEMHVRTSERHAEMSNMKHRSIGFRCVKDV